MWPKKTQKSNMTAIMTNILLCFHTLGLDLYDSHVTFDHSILMEQSLQLILCESNGLKKQVEIVYVM